MQGSLQVTQPAFCQTWGPAQLTLRSGTCRACLCLSLQPVQLARRESRGLTWLMHAWMVPCCWSCTQGMESAPCCQQTSMRYHIAHCCHYHLLLAVNRLPWSKHANTRQGTRASACEHLHTAVPRKTVSCMESYGMCTLRISDTRQSVMFCRDQIQ